MERGGVAVVAGGLFEDLGQSARGHWKQCSTGRARYFPAMSFSMAPAGRLFRRRALDVIDYQDLERELAMFERKAELFL